MSAKTRSPTQTAYVQYSKRITTAITAFWFLYRMIMLVFAFLQPSMSTAVSQLSSGVDDVMMVAIGFYCGNSVAEKGITGYFSAKGASDTSTETSNDG